MINTDDSLRQFYIKQYYHDDRNLSDAISEYLEAKQARASDLPQWEQKVNRLQKRVAREKQFLNSKVLGWYDELSRMLSERNLKKAEREKQDTAQPEHPAKQTTVCYPNPWLAIGFVTLAIIATLLLSVTLS